MVVLSELTFQIILVGILLSLITVGSIYLPRFIKKRSKKHDHLISILLSAFALASYIQLNSFVPVAYEKDYFVTGTALEQVTDKQARALSVPRAFVINEYEQRPFQIELSSGDHQLYVTVETTDYQAVVDFASEYDSLVVFNRTIDMLGYFQERFTDTYAKSANELDDVEMIKELEEAFPEHTFTLTQS
ncbi:hypothetical protein MKX54_13685 [Alkalihalobacillus sp. FSL R5-0424]